MSSPNNAAVNSATRVVAFVCDRSSRIESLAMAPGSCVEPEEGTLLLDVISAVGQAEFLVTLKTGEPGTRMLLHAVPLHKGVDEGKYLVTVCSGYRAISRGPDEVAISRAVLDTAVDAIVTINSEGLISSINPATTLMFGYSEQELIGKNVSMLMPEPFQGQHDSYLKTYLETGKASIIGVGRRVTGRKKNGNEFPVHLAVSEFSIRGSRFFTGVLHDLSKLEQVQEQLLQSERLAAIGQMVTGLAHESRNALQRAQACLDMLSLDLQQSTEQLSLVRRAATALQDLHRLYEEVRSYAAPIHLEYRECDLNSIWQKEWENLAVARGEKRIRLAESGENDHLRCEVDVHRMEHVFRNILENAIHACGDDGVITIRSSRTEMCGRPAARISFQDNGAGMTPQAVVRMFEPFFTTKQKGTGLGMAIVQRIMTAHQGAVTAGAVHPRGTEIVLIIPMYPEIRNGVRS